MAEFKRGSNYTRAQVFASYRPNHQQPTGGNLFTGYMAFDEPTDEKTFYKDLRMPNECL